MSERTITEWAFWFDADDPNDLGADIQTVPSYTQAKYWLATHLRENPDDPPRGICQREVVLTEHPWVVDTL